MDKTYKIEKKLCGEFYATYVEKIDDAHLAMYFLHPNVKCMVWDLKDNSIELFAYGLMCSSLLEKEARYHFNLAHFVLCKRDPFRDLRETLQDMYLVGEIRHNLIDIKVLGNRIYLVFGPEQPGNYTPFILYTPNDFLGHEYFNVGTFYRYNEMGNSVTHYCGPHRLFGNEEFINIWIAIKDFYMNATEI